MSDRKDFYKKQPVTSAELDAAFDGMENADRNIVADQGFTGIISGLGVTENTPTADLTVDIAAGTAYDKDGRRLSVAAAQDVDLSQDDLAASTAVGTPGNEKIIAVFIKFLRVEQDPRVDGDSNTVYFDQPESFEFSVVQSAEAPIGSATPPALDPDKILLADVTLVNAQTQIQTADIDDSRAENRTLPLAVATYGGGPDWADGTTNPSTSIENQLDKIIDDLGQNAAGSDRVLSAAIAGSPNALVQGSVYNQLGQVLADVNNHINDAAGAHADSAVAAAAYVATPDTANVSGLSVGTVESQLEEIADFLAGRPWNLGSHSTTPDATEFTALAAGTIEEQLEELADAVAGRPWLGASTNDFTGIVEAGQFVIDSPSAEFDYKNVRAGAHDIPLMSGYSKIQSGVEDWVFDILLSGVGVDNPLLGYGRVSQVDNGLCAFGFKPPLDSVLTTVRMVVTPGAVRASTFNRTRFSLFRINSDYSTPGYTTSTIAVPSSVPALHDDGTTAQQVLSWTGSINVDSSLKSFVIVAAAGDDGGGHNSDIIHSAEYRFDNPGPRNE